MCDFWLREREHSRFVAKYYCQHDAALFNESFLVFRRVLFIFFNFKKTKQTEKIQILKLCRLIRDDLTKLIFLEKIEKNVKFDQENDFFSFGEFRRTMANLLDQDVVFFGTLNCLPVTTQSKFWFCQELDRFYPK